MKSEKDILEEDTITLDDLIIVDEEDIKEDTNVVDPSKNIDNEVIEVEDTTKVVVKRRLKLFKNMSKKQRVITIIGILIVLIIIVSLVVYNVFIKDDSSESNKEDDVIIEMSNYKYENGYLIFLDNHSGELGRYKCSSDENGCYLAYSSLEEEIIGVDNVYEDDTDVLFNVPYFENYAFVYDNDEVYLYDMTNELIKEEYSSVKSVYYKGYLSSYVIVEDLDNKSGVILFDGGYELVVAHEYDYISSSNYSKSKFAFYNDEEYGIIDSIDSSVVKLSNKAYGYNDYYVAVGTMDNSKLYSMDGSDTSINNYVKFDNEYIFVIDGSLFIYNKNLSKVHESVITIDSDEIYEYRVYNDDKEVIKEVLLFDYSYDDYEFKVGSSKFDLNEVRINEKYSYINYFDGVIYFYDSLDKSIIIDTYDCDNKNKVSNGDESYKSCFVAESGNLLLNSTSKTGVSPIMSGQFVFINDTSAGASYDNIVLFDIVNKKTIATYTDFEFLSEGVVSSSGTVTSSDLSIIASNKSGNKGIIKISGKNVNSIVSFDYEYITYINNDYLAVTSSGASHIITTGGTYITSKTSNIVDEILEYNSSYIKIKKNGNEQILDSNGNIVSSEFKTIYMKTHLYVTIDSSKAINLYSYSNDTNLFNNVHSMDYDTISVVEPGSGLVTITLFDSSGNEIESYDLRVN